MRKFAERHILKGAMNSSLIIGTILVLTLGCSQTREPETVTINPFAGLWKMHTIEALDSISGEWMEVDWMKGGTGYILYDQTDNMSVIFAPKDYATSQAKWMASTDSLSLSDFNWLAQNHWYMAKYTVDEIEQTVQHERFAHVNPVAWNQVVKRKYEFNGDTMILTPLELNLRLRWIKQ